MRSLAAAPVALLVLAVVSGGCGNEVGEACTTNVDCDPLGQRVCDVSAPAGYCTVENCDQTSCPSEAVCVRFFQPLPDRPCDHDDPASCGPRERCVCDCADPNTPGGCRPGWRITDASGLVRLVCEQQAGAVASDALAHCAPESSERRWCMLRCESSADCRESEGYECRQTGTRGAEPVPTGTLDGGIPFGEPARFCVQRGA